jgi:phenylpyruvate tautomerase PptA (4-oxalocrotonate tautomerase family)
MPLYRCLVPAGSLDADTRDALAEAITTIHCSVTNVHPIFVSVVFTEYEPAAYYTGGRRNTMSVITADIRAGRDEWMPGELLTRLSESWSSITGPEARQISVCLDEVDATLSMEAGMIMPASGEEATWMRQHNRELGDLQSRG